MKFIQVFVLFMMWIGPYLTGQAQPKVPHLTAGMINKEGILFLDFNKAWRYHPGDDPNWADPALVDTSWHVLSPSALRADAMPDSLWSGYGWWRLAFTADSLLYEQITRLYFRGWGAAEVYLDGKKIQTYGKFSLQAAGETNYVPRYSLDARVQLVPHKRHVLAIRYSNHQAKTNWATLKHNAVNLGFSIGFGNEIRGAESEINYSYAVASLSIVTAILFLLLLLHLLLFFQFPSDNSNLFILLVILFFLISATTNYSHLLLPLDGFWFPIIRGLVNPAFFGMGLLLLPYTLSLIFRLAHFGWTKHLAWLFFLRFLLYFFKGVPVILLDSAYVVIILLSIGFLMRQAIKSKKPGVHYVTAGAIGTTVFLLIDRLYATSVIYLSTETFYVVLAFVYACFPIGLSVYITSRYGSLFLAMEQEVAERTHALNQSLDNLQISQSQLAAKNVENELLLKEIHHRVKNNLEIVSSLLELQMAQIEDPIVQSAMLASQNRVHSMGIIHQKLYQGEHLAAIEMRDYFINLGASILASFNAKGRIKIECNMPQLILDVDTAISIGLITNELITNSLKYAFTERAQGAIKISLNEVPAKQSGGLVLKISDNGIGKPMNSAPKGTGFGTQLIALLTKQLDGQMQYEVNGGTIVSLTFKNPKWK